MAVGYDIGASSSQSSAATSGNTGAVQISGGNTGNNTPPWLWLALAAIGFIALVVFLKGRKRK